MSAEDRNAAFEEGGRLAAAGDLKGAEAAYRRADRDGHGTAAAYVGLFEESRANQDQALAAYRRADERGDGYGAMRLGLLLSRSGDWDGAAVAWERADQRGSHEPPFAAELLARRAGYPPASAVGVASEVQRSALVNPVLLGAVTVLVAIVGVFLAYNANSGLPFVPTRQLKVIFPNGAALVAGNDVLASGYRVGIVSDMEPIRLNDGQVGAEVTIALNTRDGKVPVDSTAAIRPRSIQGLKYVDLHYGTSRRIVADGGTLGESGASALAHTTVPVQFDDINKMFDARTRPAVKQNLVGFGDALAARGSALNDTIASLPSLFGHLVAVARYLSDPRTELTRFLVALNGFFGTVSPVAQQNEQLFADQATTFAAISHSAGDLEATIRESPPTLDVSTRSLQAQQPFLADLTTFARYLGPAAAQLRDALPQVDPALEAGIRVLPRTPSMNRKLEDVLAALGAVGRDPLAYVAVNGLTQTVATLNPLIRYLGPFISVCDTWNYMWTNLAEHFSEQTRLGQAERVLINFANHQTNNVGDQGATAPADGYQLSNPVDLAAYQQTQGADAEYAHGQAYGAAIDNQGNADCEYGQRGFALSLNHLDPQHRDLATDAHAPASQGMNWSGRPHVPHGETFSREPQNGPQLPYTPANP
jgi:ABC-type transporter Mla subunit MlaD